MAVRQSNTVAKTLARGWKTGLEKIAGGEAPLYTAAAFGDLQSYFSIQKYRVVGSAVGVRDPFFREHDTRNAATTIIGGNQFINYASYDYLGLNQDRKSVV